jgi:hypothetical protein
VRNQEEKLSEERRDLNLCRSETMLEESIIEATAAARRQYYDRSRVICGVQSDSASGSLLVFPFPLTFLIPLTAP